MFAGAELGGALKNVYAIAAGIVAGKRLAQAPTPPSSRGALPRWCASVRRSAHAARR